jgi:AmmeMemoRadiSam system protein B
VAGQFYEADPAALRRQVESCYRHRLGPGDVPKLNPKGEREIQGLVCPHAGLAYSGPVAAHGYAALAADGWPDSVLILGPNHTGTGASEALATVDFQTPLGLARRDEALAKRLRRDLIEEDNVAHRKEHSLEVQLPFLLHLNPDLKFAAICMGAQEPDAAEEVGRVVRDAIADQDVLVIASTDFSHYIPKAEAARRDHLAIAEILKMDAQSFYRVKERNDVSMCGYGPVIALLTALPGAKAELLKYASSGDVAPMADVVGYASMAVRGSPR